MKTPRELDAMLRACRTLEEALPEMTRDIFFVAGFPGGKDGLAKTQAMLSTMASLDRETLGRLLAGDRETHAKVALEIERRKGMQP